MQTFRQHWPLAGKPRPIVIFGATSIVPDAHFLVYRKAGYPVLDIYDPNLEKARRLASQWDCKAFDTMELAAAETSASRMSQFQRFVTGGDEKLFSAVDHAWQTMALVEAAYISSASPATPIAEIPA